MFSAYMLDPEHGWIATHRLPLDSAVRACKEYHRITAGGLVAIVPDGEDPEPFLAFAEGAEKLVRQPRLRLVG